jgi:hypothetical protein
MAHRVGQRVQPSNITRAIELVYMERGDYMDVNKFADFLCQEVSENNTYKTKLSVVDCNSLFIIKGYTKNPKVLVLNNLTDKFIEENQDNYSDLTGLNLKTLDIIDYDTKDTNFEDTKFVFEYPETFTTNKLSLITIQSTFPNGYSKNYLGNLYSYLYKISEKSQPYFKFRNLRLEFESNEGNLKFTKVKSDSYYSSELLLSILNDNFEGKVSDDYQLPSKLFLNVI